MNSTLILLAGLFVLLVCVGFKQFFPEEFFFKIENEYLTVLNSDSKQNATKKLAEIQFFGIDQTLLDLDADSWHLIFEHFDKRGVTTVYFSSSLEKVLENLDLDSISRSFSFTKLMDIPEKLLQEPGKESSVKPDDSDLFKFWKEYSPHFVLGTGLHPQNYQMREKRILDSEISLYPSLIGLSTRLEPSEKSTTTYDQILDRFFVTQNGLIQHGGSDKSDLPVLENAQDLITVSEWESPGFQPVNKKIIAFLPVLSRQKSIGLRLDAQTHAAFSSLKSILSRETSSKLLYAELYLFFVFCFASILAIKTYPSYQVGLLVGNILFLSQMLATGASNLHYYYGWLLPLGGVATFCLICFGLSLFYRSRYDTSLQNNLQQRFGKQQKIVDYFLQQPSQGTVSKIFTIGRIELIYPNSQFTGHSDPNHPSTNFASLTNLLFEHKGFILQETQNALTFCFGPLASDEIANKSQTADAMSYLQAALLAVAKEISDKQTQEQQVKKSTDLQFKTFGAKAGLYTANQSLTWKVDNSGAFSLKTQNEEESLLNTVCGSATLFSILISENSYDMLANSKRKDDWQQISIRLNTNSHSKAFEWVPKGKVAKQLNEAKNLYVSTTSYSRAEERIPTKNPGHFGFIANETFHGHLTNYNRNGFLILLDNYFAIDSELSLRFEFSKNESCQETLKDFKISEVKTVVRWSTSGAASEDSLFAHGLEILNLTSAQKEVLFSMITSQDLDASSESNYLSKALLSAS